MGEGLGTSRKEAVVAGVLCTLVVLLLLAGLGWFGYSLPTQPQTSAPRVSGGGNGSRASTEAPDLQAARARAADGIPLVDLSGMSPSRSSARNDAIAPEQD